VQARRPSNRNGKTAAGFGDALKTLQAGPATETGKPAQQQLPAQAEEPPVEGPFADGQLSSFTLAQAVPAQLMLPAVAGPGGVWPDLCHALGNRCGNRTGNSGARQPGQDIRAGATRNSFRPSPAHGGRSCHPDLTHCGGIGHHGGRPGACNTAWRPGCSSALCRPRAREQGPERRQAGSRSGADRTDSSRGAVSTGPGSIGSGGGRAPGPAGRRRSIASRSRQTRQ